MGDEKQRRSILSYKVFRNQSDLVAWQKNNPEYGIKSITPLMDNIDFKHYEKKNPETYDRSEGSVEIAVFVIYFWNEAFDG